MAILFNSRDRTPARYFCTFRQAGCSAGARRSLRHDCLGHEIRKAVGRSGYRNGNIRHRPATKPGSRGGGAAAAVFIGYAQCHDGRDGQSGDIDSADHIDPRPTRRPSIFGRASRARRCFDLYRFRASMLRERTRLRPCRLSESRVPSEDHVLPVLGQFSNLYPRAHGSNPYEPFANQPPFHPIVDLSDYDAVSRFRRHIARAISLPIEHPNHMPVTRDLSPAKREMLLRFFSQLDRGDASRSMPASTAPAAAATPGTGTRRKGRRSAWRGIRRKNTCAPKQRAWLEPVPVGLASLWLACLRQSWPRAVGDKPDSKQSNPSTEARDYAPHSRQGDQEPR